MNPAEFALQVRGLTKRFDRVAVDALDLTVRCGEFYALLGPNGAGKTTTLRMVAGLLRPDAGSVSVLGIDALSDPVAAKQITAWVSDEPMIYDKLTPLEYLEFVAGLWGIDPAVSQASAHSLLVSLGLEPHLHERCEGFSKGMRQKVALAGALVHDPRLIILDEPLTGLDALSARHVKGLLQERVRSGCTVIMTTHILEVAERMADRIGVIAAGRLIAEGTLAELRQQNGQNDTSLEDMFIALVDVEAAAHEFSRGPELVCPARNPAGLARMAGDDDGRAGLTKAACDRWPDCFRRDHASAGLCRGRQVRKPCGAARQTALIVITSTILLAWALMLSQAIELVTRVFYARADLDLIMSSPVALANVFSVRIAAIALTVTAMALVLSTPFVDVLVIGGGIRWFSAYGVVVAIGLSAAAVAIAMAITLFRLIGPSRTRLVSQILAAIIGAGFVIALQIAAILSYGTLSRFAVLTSDAAAAYAPGVDSIVWWPARAALGDGEALLLLLSGGLVLLGAVMAIFSPRFADTAVSVTANAAPAHRGHAARTFRAGSRQQALRRKELLLLRRDPWLVSQTLMQLLYLVPPALMLWRSFAGTSTAIVLITPVVVMAAGQLAGGLAWLTISGEDAADLVTTAPTAVLASDACQDRGGADRDRRPVRAADRSLGICLVAAGGHHHARRRDRLRIGYRDTTLVSGAGPAQPVSPPPDLVTAGDFRGSLFLDRVGRDRGTGAGDPDRRRRQRPADHRHPRGNLEDQPAAGVSGGRWFPAAVVTLECKVVLPYI